MLNVGFSELLLFGIIALIVLGPEKLPVAARTAGRWYAHLRRLASNLQQDIEKEIQLSELREHMQQELGRIKAIEKQMQAQLDQMHHELAELHPNSTENKEKPALQIYALLPCDSSENQHLHHPHAPYTRVYQHRLLNPDTPNSIVSDDPVIRPSVSTDTNPVTETSA